VTRPQLLPDRRSPSSSNEPIAQAPSMIEAFSLARAFAPAATPVILYGESGTGKTFFAEFIHQLSERPGGFHAFSLGIVPTSLAADELFGHVQGAFTDAHKVRMGRIASAGSGTLLLDDLHTLDLGMQKQLLQVLDRGTYSAVGGDRVQTVACRMVFAMTEDPDTLMMKGLLLRDLRYRFGECGIAIPALRERRDEIPLHAQRMLQRCAEWTKIEGPTRFSAGALALLCEGEYDGNVRQLEGIVLRAFLIARYRGACQIDVDHLPQQLTPRLLYRRHGDLESNQMAVERILRITGGNVKKAAQMLGVSRTTINAARRSP
jgi:DNA-binding NtrC family response regulator